MSLPEAGLQSVSLSGGGSTYQLEVVPMPGIPLARPVVSADGQNLVISFAASPQLGSQTARLDLNQPGSVPQATYAPPLQPRAVAPPLGDMAVGSMVIRRSSGLSISGPRVTLTLKNAPIKEALMLLTRLGGYGLVYVSASANDPGVKADNLLDAETFSSKQAESGFTYKDDPKPVTVSFVSENYSAALDAVLLAAGIQAKLQGRTLYAGPGLLSRGIGSQFSKIYRLNQATPQSAAQYLASLGAKIFYPNTVTQSSSQGSSTNTGQGAASGGSTASSTTSSSSTSTQIDSYSSDQGPLLGLQGTIDSRLGTITLVGDPPLVGLGEAYLRQIDLRQRQVALSVKILDINLTNDTGVDNSFAFRYGNSFIVSESGQLNGFFGDFLPSVGSPSANPGLAYPQKNLYDALVAQIKSRNTKVLASPTLILSENSDPIVSGDSVSGSGGAASKALTTASIGRKFSNESFVTVGAQVITNYTIVQGANQTGNSCQPDFDTAGLSFGARVSKIDDNGFVTFALSPSVSAVTSTDFVENCGPINILSLRRLDTGSLRVRDGQTLILTGVISDADIQTVTKWPILGDIPFIGQFFRSSGSSKQKNELVIMVTPRIIDDGQGGGYGYGFSPSGGQARRLLNGSM
jgi:type IV pilus assembly protein PilQ